MLAIVGEAVVLVAVLGAIQTTHTIVLLWLASAQRQQILACVRDIGRAGVVVEHRGADGTLLTVRPGERAVRSRGGGRS